LQYGNVPADLGDINVAFNGQVDQNAVGAANFPIADSL